MSKDKDEKKKPALVFLNDGRFVEWKRPPRIQRDGRIYLGSFMGVDASTQLKDYLGLDTFSGGFSDYVVFASAAKYLANISPWGKEGIIEAGKKPSNPAEEMILFAGTIAFYKNGSIPGTELHGMDFVRHGEIFTARKPSLDLRISSGLRTLIFEGCKSSAEKLRRIEAIIRGYEEQELEERDGQRDAVLREYRRGALDEHEAANGTFSQSSLAIDE